MLICTLLSIYCKKERALLPHLYSLTRSHIQQVALSAINFYTDDEVMLVVWSNSDVMILKHALRHKVTMLRKNMCYLYSEAKLAYYCKQNILLWNTLIPFWDVWGLILIYRSGHYITVITIYSESVINILIHKFLTVVVTVIWNWSKIFIPWIMLRYIHALVLMQIQFSFFIVAHLMH